VLQIKDIEHKKGQTVPLHSHDGAHVIVPVVSQHEPDRDSPLPSHQFTNLCVVGGLGGNFSHELANVNILFKYRQRRIFLLSDLNLV
jgi:thiamine pyrophosphokinase